MVSIVGETGTGKSTLEAWLQQFREHVVICRSKPDDVRYPGTKLIRRAEGLDDIRYKRVVLDPKYEHQAREFWLAFDKVWHQGGWCVVLDELYYLDNLGLKWPINRLLTQGRSKGVSVVSGMQRPVAVTRFALGESRHIISFGLEGRDAAELGHATNRTVADVAKSLDEHQFVWYRKPGSIFVGKLDVRAGVIKGRRVE